MKPTRICGKDLACWCGKGPCHADVLIEMANMETAVAAQSPAAGEGDKA